MYIYLYLLGFYLYSGTVFAVTFVFHLYFAWTEVVLQAFFRALPLPQVRTTAKSAEKGQSSPVLNRSLNAFENWAIFRTFPENCTFRFDEKKPKKRYGCPNGCPFFRDSNPYNPIIPPFAKIVHLNLTKKRPFSSCADIWADIWMDKIPRLADFAAQARFP